VTVLGSRTRADDAVGTDRRLFVTDGPLEFRLQIVVEVAAAEGRAAGEGAPATRGDPGGGSRLPRVFEAARSFLRDLSEDLGVRTATLAWPSGMRLVAQGVASPEDLAGIQTAAAALSEVAARSHRSRP
jgi:hypothetical protein